jgi:hypothetical protein
MHIKNKYIKIKQDNEKYKKLLEEAAEQIIILGHKVDRNPCSSENSACACTGYCLKEEVKTAFKLVDNIYDTLP